MPAPDFIKRMLRIQNRLAPGRRKRLPRPPKWQFPHRSQLLYQRALFEVLDHFRQAVTDLLIPALPALAKQAAPAGKRDSWVDDLAAIRKALRIRGEQGINADAIAEAISVDVSAWNLNQWRKVAAATIGIDPVTAEPWLRDSLTSWAHENAGLIKTLADNQTADVERWTIAGLRAGDRHEDIADKIMERMDVSRSRAQLLARDQTSKLNGDLTRKRQEDAGVSRYIWRTSHDERVRGNPSGKYPDAHPSHYVMDGKVCRWDDPTVYLEGKDWVSRASIGGVELHPGEDYQDRCTAEPVMDDLLKGLDEE